MKLRLHAETHLNHWGFGIHFVGGAGPQGIVLFVGPFSFALEIDR